MKRLIALVMAFCMLLTAGAFAADFELSIFVNGEKLYFPDAAPFIDANSRTLVPVRFVSEALNANVEWNGDLRQVTVTKGEKVIVLTIDSKEMIVNGDTKTQDSAPIISESRTFVPLRFVSEELDANVVWNGEVRAVYITTEGEAQGDAGITYEDVNINGFVVHVEDGEDVVKDSTTTVVRKKSGLSVTFREEDGHIMAVKYYKLSDNDPELARKEIESILSQRISSEEISKLSKYLSDSLPDKEYKEKYSVKNGGLIIRIVSTRSEVSITVSNDNT